MTGFITKQLCNLYKNRRLTIRTHGAAAYFSLFQMAPKVEKLAVPQTPLGEGPHWDSKRQTLYFVDLLEKALHRYVPATKEHAKTLIKTEFTPSFIIPIAGSSDLFAVNLGHKVHVLRWDGQTDTPVHFERTVAELDLENEKNIINDGKVDPRGRLFTGTIGNGLPAEGEAFNCLPTGSLYSVTTGGVVKAHDTGVTCSNGLAFDPIRKALYHVDTFQQAIRKFDYDVETGETSNKTIFFDYKEANAEGFPDGMAIDTDGNLWVASYDGSCVLKINPDTGKLAETIQIPDKQVTSVNFGGPNLDVLFVTTGYGWSKAENPNGGGTYAVTGLGARGYENLPFDYKI